MQPPIIIRPHLRDRRLIPESYVEGQEKYIYGEWLVTNGLGGYSSSTVVGIVTRRYHALLVSSLPPPLGRMIMFNHLTEEVNVGDKKYLLNCEEMKQGHLNLEALKYLKSFYLENGLPVWIYDVNGIIIEKRIFMPYRQNTVFICYKLLEGAEDVTLKLYPALHFRSHEGDVNSGYSDPYSMNAVEDKYEIRQKDLPPLRLALMGTQGSFTFEARHFTDIFFHIESARGYESIGQLWNPGYFQIHLFKGKETALVGSTESWQTMFSLSLPQAQRAESDRRRLLYNQSKPYSDEVFVAELIIAADQFIITPENRVEDTVRAHAAGDEIRTVIAGYHWFTDWGRDTMISLEGLTLYTGRAQEARWILKTFSHYVKDGLIPNLFPEGKHSGLYNTADATLWFFHAVGRYVAATGDVLTLQELLPVLRLIIKKHLDGTRFGIHAAAEDYLIQQGAEGYQLTWMDAKVGDWIVTPRRGKTVEINALWYNALRYMELWHQQEGESDKAEHYGRIASYVQASFNKRFWIEDRHYLYDLVDGEKGDDAAFRPNQIFAISLDFPVLDKKYWKDVLDQCHQKLLTPFGLRTLSIDHVDFKAKYMGDLRARDAAYHQGTVWPWLIGHFIDAWLKVYPDKKVEAHDFLKSFEMHISDSGIGTISEIFDAIEPYIPRGCMAQAWSVAEVLRSWIKTRS